MPINCCVGEAAPARSLCPEDETGKSATLHVLEQQHPVHPFFAVPDHTDQVLVVDTANGLHLIFEISFGVLGQFDELLHRHMRRLYIAHFPFANFTSSLKPLVAW